MKKYQKSAYKPVIARLYTKKEAFPLKTVGFSFLPLRRLCKKFSVFFSLYESLADELEKINFTL